MRKRKSAAGWPKRVLPDPEITMIGSDPETPSHRGRYIQRNDRHLFLGQGDCRITRPRRIPVYFYTNTMPSNATRCMSVRGSDHACKYPAGRASASRVCVRRSLHDRQAGHIHPDGMPPMIYNTRSCLSIKTIFHPGIPPSFHYDLTPPGPRSNLSNRRRSI